MYVNEWSFVHLSQVLQCDCYLHIYEDECLCTCIMKFYLRRGYNKMVFDCNNKLLLVLVIIL